MGLPPVAAHTVNRRGVTLVELLLAVSLAAVVAVSAAGLFRAGLRTARATETLSRSQGTAARAFLRVGTRLRNAVPAAATPTVGTSERLRFATLPPGDTDTAAALLCELGPLDGGGGLALTLTPLSPGAAPTMRRELAPADMRAEWAFACRDTRGQPAWADRWEADLPPDAVKLTLHAGGEPYEKIFIVPQGRRVPCAR